MPRELRYHVPETFYHVIARGNDRHAIFMQDADYQFYLSRLEKYAEKFSVRLHAYALMGNHVHLLVQEWEQPLSRFMQGVQQSYTQYVNRNYERVGHVFQGRYKAFRLDTDQRLLAVMDYIHNNPVKAGLVPEPVEYRWSSQRHYSRGNGEGLVETGFLKAMIDKNDSVDLPEYEPEVRSSKQLPIVSSGSSIGGVSVVVANNHIPLVDILDRVASLTRVPPEQILGRRSSRGVAAARRLFIIAAVEHGHTLTAVCRLLGRSSSGVTEAFQSIQLEARQDRFLQEMLRMLRGKTEKNEA